MSGITSSVGLVSGLPTAELISQLIAVEARPMELLQQRQTLLQAERTAFAEIAARLLALKSTALRFDEPAFFRAFSANSSDPDVLTASANENATVGTFSFRVHSLVSNNELLSQGFSDAGTTPVGVGTITLETGNGLLNPATDLEELNGGQGVRRGRIEITDRLGDTAEVDLTAALTVQDVVDEINSQTAINVQARVSGDRIVLEDLNGTELEGSLTVRDLAGGHMAEDLGLNQSVSALAGIDLAQVQGDDIINLVDSTLLTRLNDGNGIGRSVAESDFTIKTDLGDEFEVSLSGNIDGNTNLKVLNNGNGVRLGVVRITDRSGATVDVDLSGAVKLQDVVDAIDTATQAAGMSISTTFFNSSGKHAFQISDGSTSEDDDGVLKFEDVDGFAARDLGIAAEGDDGNLIGNGIHRITTVGDVLRAIEYAYDSTNGQYNESIRATISSDGNGIELISSGVAPGFEVIAGADSTAAEDLGILGVHASGVATSGKLIAGMNTVLMHSLNGGSGVGEGSIQITDRANNSVTVDLSGAETVQEMLEAINDQAAAVGVGITASVNRSGNGIMLKDTSDGAGATIEIADVDGTAAADLGIAGSFAEDVVQSGSLQLQYISGRSLLSGLNNDRGVRTGTFRITDSAGAVTSVNITDSQKTLEDVLRLINASSETLEATINENGDGILITDSAGGDSAITIEDTDGFAAKDLHIAGEAKTGENFIDGSFEVRIEIDADDTLDDVVAKIGEAGADVSASVLNDGSDNSPYRLVISSEVSGAKGRIILDAGTTGLAMDTLTEARDAVVFFGGADSENPLVLRSSTNSLDDVIAGVSIDLQSTNKEAVELSVRQDVDAIAEELNNFVTAYNDVFDRIDDLTSFDADTFERGILFGDSTISTVENRVFRVVTQQFDVGSSTVSRLSNIGFSIASGGRLSFDEEKFRQAYGDDPDAVEQLFTTEETGFGAVIDSVLDELTRSTDGLLARKDDSLGDQEDLLGNRIVAMQDVLDLKRARLEREFAALESSLAGLQGQQTALSQLSALAGG